MIGFKTYEDYSFDECIDFINQYDSSHPLWIDINQRYSDLLKKYKQEDDHFYKNCTTKDDYKRYISLYSNISGASKYNAQYLDDAYKKIRMIKIKGRMPIIIITTIGLLWLTIYIGIRFYDYTSTDNWICANKVELWIGTILEYPGAQREYGERHEDAEWYRKAALQGDSWAQQYLGHSYEFGEDGVGKDLKKAFYWYHKAANQNLTYSQAKLGDFYRWGEDGINKNEKEAYKWYSMASSDQDYMDKIGDCYYYGIGISQDYNKAIEWYKKGASGELYNHWAAYRLGCCYYYGDGVQKDYKKAVEIFEKESEYNRPKFWAKYMLGLCYYNGNGVPCNYNKAEELFQEASQGGISRATEMLKYFQPAE